MTLNKRQNQAIKNTSLLFKDKLYILAEIICGFGVMFLFVAMLFFSMVDDVPRSTLTFIGMLSLANLCANVGLAVGRNIRVKNFWDRWL